MKSIRRMVYMLVFFASTVLGAGVGAGGAIGNLHKMPPRLQTPQHFFKNLDLEGSK